MKTVLDITVAYIVFSSVSPVILLDPNPRMESKILEFNLLFIKWLYHKFMLLNTSFYFSFWKKWDSIYIFQWMMLGMVHIYLVLWTFLIIFILCLKTPLSKEYEVGREGWRMQGHLYWRILSQEFSPVLTAILKYKYPSTYHT